MERAEEEEGDEEEEQEMDWQSYLDLIDQQLSNLEIEGDEDQWEDVEDDEESEEESEDEEEEEEDGAEEDADADADDDGTEVSEYEKLRRERIARNSQFLATLGLGGSSTGNASGGGAITKMVGSKPKRKYTKQKKKRVSEGPARQSARNQGRDRVSYKEVGINRTAEEREEEAAAKKREKVTCLPTLVPV